MKTKADDVIVDDPDEAMRRFQSALGKIVKVPKTQFKAKHERTKGRPKKSPKR